MPILVRRPPSPAVTVRVGEQTVVIRYGITN